MYGYVHKGGLLIAARLSMERAFSIEVGCAHKMYSQRLCKLAVRIIDGLCETISP